MYQFGFKKLDRFVHDLQKVLWSILGGVNLDIFQYWNWKMKLVQDLLLKLDISIIYVYLFR